MQQWLMTCIGQLLHSEKHVYRSLAQQRLHAQMRFTDISMWLQISCNPDVCGLSWHVGTAFLIEVRAQ